MASAAKGTLWKEAADHALALSAICLVTAAPFVLFVCFFTQMSPFAVTTLDWILTVPGLYRRVLFVTAVTICALVWFSIRWFPSTSFWVAFSALLVASVPAFVLALPDFPCTVVMILVASGPALLAPLRKVVFQDMSPRAWAALQCIATGIPAVLGACLWIAWVARGFPGRDRWYDWPPPFGAMVLEEHITWKLAFVLWASPLAGASELGVLCLVYWLRHRYLAIDAQEDKDAYIGRALKQLLCALASLAMLLWITAALSVEPGRDDMREETVWMVGCTMLVLSYWSIARFGQENIARAVGNSKVLEEAVGVLENEWVKGFFLLVCAVPLSLYVLIHVCAVSVCGIGRDWQWPLIAWLRQWHWAGTLSKAVILGFVYVYFVVTLGKAMVLVLAVTTEAIAGFPVFTVSLIVFLVGFAIFLLPSAPALPVYVLMGVVIGNSAQLQGWSWELGLAWAVFVTFAMKLAFTAAAIFCIGGPLSEHKAVRRAICIHTPYMRAVEEILRERYSLAKAAVLTGGPDWPAAVLCGIMKIDAWPVMVCISPVLLQSVFPSVLSGVLLLDAQTKSHRDGHAEGDGLAEATLIVAGALQLATSILAFVYIQELEAKQLLRVTAWEFVPLYAKSTLLLGLVCTQASMALFVIPMVWYDLLQEVRPLGFGGGGSRRQRAEHRDACWLGRPGLVGRGSSFSRAISRVGKWAEERGYQ